MTRNITNEDIKNATTYIPIMEKTRLINEIAPLCIASVGVTLEEEGKDGYKTPMPDAYLENSLAKQLFLRGILVGRYLGLPVDGKYPTEIEDYQIPANEYDWYENLVGQIDRFKSRTTDTELRDKAYALLADYKEFEKRLNADIHKLITVKSDFCTRFMAMVSMQTTPEAVKAAQEEMQALQSELLKFQKSKKKGKNE